MASSRSKKDHQRSLSFDRPLGRNAIYTVTIVDLRRYHSSLNSLHHIGLEILSILDSAAESNQVVKHPRRLSLRLWDSRMRHASRNLDQTLDPSKTLS